MKITINGQIFGKYISEKRIHTQIDNIAKQINHDLAKDNPLFITVLMGAKAFADELYQRLTIPHEITEVRLQSYSGTESTGTIKTLQPLSQSVVGRTVVVVEDIIDSGITISHIIKQLKSAGAAKVIVATLLSKKDAHKVKDLPDPDYYAFSIPNVFVIGFGLDYNEHYRELPCVYAPIGSPSC